MIDNDRIRPRDELIDIFVVDLVLEANKSMSLPNLTGINNISTMSLQFEARCLFGFTGSFCALPMNEIPEAEDGLSRAGWVGFGVVITLVFLLLVILLVMAVLCRFVVKQQRRKNTFPAVSTESVQDHDHSSLV